MNKFILSILSTLFCLYAFGQNKIPQNRYKTKSITEVNKEFIGNSKYISHLRFIGNYSYMNFLNENYSINKANDKVKTPGGFNVGVEYFFKIFKVGARYTYNSFEITDPLAIDLNNDMLDIESQGVESKIDLMLLPQIKHFSLFVGVGYGHQWMSLEKNDSEEKKSFGEPIWNVGFDAFIAPSFTVFGEYIQSIDNESDYAYSRFNVGVGYTY